MVRLEIPIDWTAEHALTVVGFLDTLVTAIWQTYGSEMAEALEAKAEYDYDDYDDACDDDPLNVDGPPRF